MKKHRLSEIELEKVKCKFGASHTEFFDHELPGFYLDVLKSGRKSYRLRYRANKRLRVLTIGDAQVISLEEAKGLAIDLIRKAKFGIDPKLDIAVLNGPSIEEFFVNKYLPYVKSYKRSWTTDLSMVKNHVITKLGHLKMVSLTATDVIVFVGQMKSENYALGTCNRAIVLLRYGFELALRWQIEGVKNNPVKEVKNLKDDSKIERYLTPLETQRLLQAIRESESEMLQYIVLFLIYTGARKREVLEAKWRDIDWAQKSWRIPKTKSGKVRHVPLSTGAMDVIQTLRKKIQYNFLPDAPIFLNKRTGKPFVSFFYSWNNARIRAGLPEFRIHDLRHSFASCLVNAGRSLYEVQELLGHADIKTTSRYAHLSRERLIEAVEFVPHIKIGAMLPLGAQAYD
jgi:integrase